MNELEKLKAEHTALGERIAKLEAAEPDYSKWVGRLVEARDNCSTGWCGPYVLSGYYPQHHRPFNTGGYGWDKARLYHGTHKLNMIPHDGSDDCPVSQDQPVVVVCINGPYSFGFGTALKWRKIGAYCPVELCHD